jgi:hypothetical protein
MYRVRTSATVTQIVTRALFWDGVLEKFVADPAVPAQTFSGTSLNGQYTFETLGRKFYVLVYSLAHGVGEEADVDVDIEVSGFGSTNFD